MNSTALVPFTLCLLLFLTILMPAIGVWDYRRLLKKLREGRAKARLEAYFWTIALQWVITLGFMAWWLLSGGELAPLGLVPQVEGLQWLVIGAGLAVLVFILIQMVLVLRSQEKLEQVRQQSREIRGIAPQTPTEQRVFTLVSITAGICEEILFRGLLLTVLAVAMGLWPALVLSSAIFGLGHAYQGWKGMGKTAAAGLVLALLAVGSGSLFVPILLHAVGDMTSGHMLGTASRNVSLSY
jgi:membrane protease YdiL (CAAX protease family)